MVALLWVLISSAPVVPFEGHAAACESAVAHLSGKQREVAQRKAYIEGLLRVLISNLKIENKSTSSHQELSALEALWVDQKTLDQVQEAFSQPLKVLEKWKADWKPIILSRILVSFGNVDYSTGEIEEYLLKIFPEGLGAYAKVSDRRKPRIRDSRYRDSSKQLIREIFNSPSDPEWAAELARTDSKVFKSKEALITAARLYFLDRRNIYYIRESLLSQFPADYRSAMDTFAIEAALNRLKPALETLVVKSSGKTRGIPEDSIRAGLGWLLRPDQDSYNETELFRIYDHLAIAWANTHGETPATSDFGGMPGEVGFSYSRYKQMLAARDLDRAGYIAELMSLAKQRGLPTKPYEDELFPDEMRDAARLATNERVRRAYKKDIVKSFTADEKNSPKNLLLAGLKRAKGLDLALSLVHERFGPKSLSREQAYEILDQKVLEWIKNHNGEIPERKYFKTSPGNFGFSHEVFYNRNSEWPPIESILRTTIELGKKARLQGIPFRIYARQFDFVDNMPKEVFEDYRDLLRWSASKAVLEYLERNHRDRLELEDFAPREQGKIPFRDDRFFGTKTFSDTVSISIFDSSAEAHLYLKRMALRLGKPYSVLEVHSRLMTDADYDRLRPFYRMEALELTTAWLAKNPNREGLSLNDIFGDGPNQVKISIDRLLHNDQRQTWIFEGLADFFKSLQAHLKAEREKSQQIPRLSIFNFKKLPLTRELWPMREIDALESMRDSIFAREKLFDLQLLDKNYIPFSASTLFRTLHTPNAIFVDKKSLWTLLRSSLILDPRYAAKKELIDSILLQIDERLK